jgi:casein kinase 1
MLLQGKYSITKLIGTGTYSRVYAGYHEVKGTNVAIKFDAENNTVAKKLIEHEIRMYMQLKKFKIQNIVNIKTYGVYNNHHYLIMDYLPFTLEEVIKKTKDQHNVECLCDQMYLILSKLHAHEIVHRDIKPENFMVSEKGRVYLIDLGLSCISNNTPCMTSPIGTTLFCSFQCHLSSYSYTPRDDMISLYYVIFYLLSAEKLPWEHICIDNGRLKNNLLYTLKKETNYYKYYSTESNGGLYKWIRKYLECVSDIS